MRDDVKQTFTPKTKQCRPRLFKSQFRPDNHLQELNSPSFSQVRAYVRHVSPAPYEKPEMTRRVHQQKYDPSVIGEENFPSAAKSTPVSPKKIMIAPPEQFKLEWNETQTPEKRKWRTGNKSLESSKDVYMLFDKTYGDKTLESIDFCQADTDKPQNRVF